MLLLLFIIGLVVGCSKFVSRNHEWNAKPDSNSLEDQTRLKPIMDSDVSELAKIQQQVIPIPLLPQETLELTSSTKYFRFCLSIN